jgi:hypothetical protein
LNEEFETQSMATNASRFFSKLNPRNANLEGDNERTRNIKTNLVPENSKTEEKKIFRQTFWSNFTKNGGFSIRSEDCDGDETKNISPEHEN